MLEPAARITRRQAGSAASRAWFARSRFSRMPSTWAMISARGPTAQHHNSRPWRTDRRQVPHLRHLFGSPLMMADEQGYVAREEHERTDVYNDSGHSSQAYHGTEAANHCKQQEEEDLATPAQRQTAHRGPRHTPRRVVVEARRLERIVVTRARARGQAHSRVGVH